MSKIPEGATHTAPNGTYRMTHESLWYGYVDGDWIYIEGANPHFYTKIQTEQEWSGEGLPTVGAIVYCRSHNRDVEILKEPELVPYVSAPCRALDNDELFWGGDFSPIKTPEQIAADERDKARTFALNAMTEDGKTASEPEALWKFRMKVVGEMLDLGFRVDKQVEK